MLVDVSFIALFARSHGADDDPIPDGFPVKQKEYQQVLNVAGEVVRWAERRAVPSPLQRARNQKR